MSGQAQRQNFPAPLDFGLEWLTRGEEVFRGPERQGGADVGSLDKDLVGGAVEAEMVAAEDERRGSALEFIETKLRLDLEIARSNQAGGVKVVAHAGTFQVARRMLPWLANFECAGGLAFVNELLKGW